MRNFLLVLFLSLGFLTFGQSEISTEKGVFLASSKIENSTAYITFQDSEYNIVESLNTFTLTYDHFRLLNYYVLCGYINDKNTILTENGGIIFITHYFRFTGKYTCITYTDKDGKTSFFPDLTEEQFIKLFNIKK
jgi:hypothetical protein